MSIDISDLSANGAGKLSVSAAIMTSTFAWLEINSLGIGSLCAITTLIIYATVSVLNYRRGNLAQENKDRLDKLDNKGK